MSVETNRPRQEPNNKNLCQRSLNLNSYRKALIAKVRQSGVLVPDKLNSEL